MSFSYKINQLYGQDSGGSEHHHAEKEFVLENGTWPIEYDVTLLKTEDSIIAVVENLTIEPELQCSKCLKNFSQLIEIQTAEREFLFETPRHTVEDEHDLFLANLHQMSIDLEEMLRQEILLHFPLNPLCSTSCKGLCLECGKDQNKEKCKHPKAKKEEIQEIKPFRNLKNLLT